MQHNFHISAGKARMSDNACSTAEDAFICEAPWYHVQAACSENSCLARASCKKEVVGPCVSFAEHR